MGCLHHRGGGFLPVARDRNRTHRDLLFGWPPNFLGTPPCRETGCCSTEHEEGLHLVEESNPDRTRRVEYSKV